MNTSTNTAKKKLQQPFIQRLAQKLSLIPYSLCYNSLIAPYGYCFFIIVENAIMGFFLIADAHTTQQESQNQSIKASEFIESNTNSEFAVAFLAIILVLMICALAISGFIAFKTINYEHASHVSYLRKSLQIFISVSRTVLTQIVFLALKNGIGKLDKSDDENSYIIVCQIVLIVVLLIPCSILSFAICTPQLPQLPWTQLNYRFMLLKEALKGLLVIQGVFLDSVRQSQIAIIAYYSGLTLILGFNAIEDKHYSNHLVARVSRICEGLLLSITFFCLFRLLVSHKFEESLIYLPILAYSIQKAQIKFRQKSLSKLAIKLKISSSLNEKDVWHLLSSVGVMFNQKSYVNDVQLQQIVLAHKMTCFEEDCECNLQSKILIENFKYHQKNMKQVRIPQNQQAYISEDIPMSFIRQLSSKEVSDDPTNLSLHFPKEQSDIEISERSFHPDRINISRGPYQLGGNMNIQNLTFSFETNAIVTRLVLDDLCVKQSIAVDEQDQQKKQEENYLKSRSQARTFLISEILITMFKNHELFKRPRDIVKHLDLYLFFSNFVVKHSKRKFLALYQLMKLNQAKNKLNFFQLVKYLACEQVIMNAAIDGIDSQAFIDADEQTIKLDQLYKSTTEDVITFWKGLLKEDCKATQQLKVGMQISSNLIKIKKQTLKLSLSNHFTKDLGKYQLYALFFLDVLHDPVTSGEMASQVKNAQAYRNKAKWAIQTRDNSIYGKQDMKDQANQAVFIVEALPSNRQQQKILQANKQFCELFRIKEAHIQGQSLKSIMPSVVAEQHDSIVRRAFESGVMSQLGKHRILLAKNFSGYVFPVELSINFAYHPSLGQVFIAKCEKVLEAQLYQEQNQRIKTSDCVYMISDQSLTITEHSQSFLNVLGLSKSEMKIYQDQVGKALTLYDCIDNLQQQLQELFGECLLPLSLDKHLVNKVVNIKKYNQILHCFDRESMVACLLNYIQYNYLDSKDPSLRLHLFTLVPINKLPEYEAFSNINPSTNQALKFGTGTIKKSSINTYLNSERNPSQIKLESEEQMSDMYDFSSLSSNTSSSSGSTSMQGHMAKNQLFQNRSPKILKITAIVTILLFLTSFGISIFNVSSFLDKYQYISGRLESITRVSQRSQNVRAALLELKMIQAIAFDGAEISESEIIPKNQTRIGYFYNDLMQKFKEIKTDTDIYNQYIMLNRNFFSFSTKFENLKFLTANGVTYYEDTSFKHAVDLLTSYGETISLQDMQKQKPAINVSSYANINKPVFKRLLTPLEQTLYFIFQNGLYEMASLGQKQVWLLTEACYKQTEESLSVLNTITFASIGVITALTLLLIPFLFKIITRYLRVFRIFIKVNKETTQHCLNKSLNFRSIMYRRMTNQEVKLTSDEESTTQKPNLDIAQAEQDKNQIVNSKKQQKLKAPQFKVKTRDSQFMKQKRNKNQAKKIKKLNAVFKQSNKYEESKEEDEQNQSNNHRDKEDEESSNEEVQSQVTKQESEKQIQRQQERPIVTQISRIETNYRLWIGALILILIGYFNSSLIVQYTQSQQVFENDKSNFDFQKIYSLREECAYNLIVFFREKAIFRKRLPIDIYLNSSFFQSQPAVFYYIDECFANENKVAAVSRQSPEFLKEAQSMMRKFRSPEVCDIVFDGQENESCKSAMDGILTKGLAGTMNYLITLIQQLNLNIEADPVKSDAFIKSLLDNKRLNDLTDLIIYYFYPLVGAQQQTIKEAAETYFETAHFEYLLVFGVYLTITILLLVICGSISYFKIKSRLLQIQNVLVLIPLDLIDQSIKHEIEAYVSS